MTNDALAEMEWLAGIGMRIEGARKHDRVNALIAVKDLARLLALAEECLRRRNEAER